MVESEILSNGDIVIIIQILADIFRLPVTENKPADLSPLSQAVYPVSFRINLFPTLHAFMIGCVDKAVIQISAVVRQDIRVRPVKEHPLDPMILIYWIERHPDLVKLPRGKLSTETVVENLEVILCNLRSFFNPDVCQLPAGERNGFQLFPLPVIVDTTENNLVSIGPAGHLQRTLLDVPKTFPLFPKHAVCRTSQLSISTVPIRDV